VRIFTAIAIWCVILGSVTSFLGYRDSKQISPGSQLSPSAQTTSDVYALAITPTFNAEPDPFALQTDATAPSAALVVRMGQTDLLRVTDNVEAGKPLRVDSFVKIGINEIYIEGSPPIARSLDRHAILVELFRNDILIQQASFWSIPGGKVTGTMRFDVTEENTEHGH
jgi:hypothetical protein